MATKVKRNIVLLMGSFYFWFVVSDGNKERKAVNDGRMCGVSGKV